jgi:ABC-type branched-subunit amino acid transport system substrate-binding protein
VYTSPGSRRRADRARRSVRHPGVPLRAGVVALAVITLAACGNGSSSGGGGGDSTIKIGLFASTTGSLATTGKLVVAMAQALVKQTNDAGGISGHQLQLIVKDETGNTSDAISAMRDFHNAGVTVALGFAQTNDCRAAAPYMNQYKMTVLGTCEDSQMVGPDRLAKGFYEALFTVATNSEFMGTMLAKLYPDVKTVDVLMGDYAYSHEYAEGVLAALKRNGVEAKFGDTYFVPLTALNYQSQIAAIQRNADKQTGLLFLPPAQTTFLQQAVTTKLGDSLAYMVSAGSYVANATPLNGTAPTVWESGGYGIQQIYDSSAATFFDKDANAKFKQFVQTATGQLPNENVNAINAAIQTLFAGLKATGGDTDPTTLQAAIDKVQISVPIGSAKVDPESHIVAQNLVGYQTVGDPAAQQKLKLVQAYVLPEVGSAFPGAAAIQKVFPG